MGVSGDEIRSPVRHPGIMGSRLTFITPLLVAGAAAAVVAPTALADPTVAQPATIASAPTALTSHIVSAVNGRGLHGGGGSALP
jgi:hypothetical protein